MKKYSVLLVVLGSILWGTDSLFRRPLSRELSPVTIVYLEHCILSLVTLPLVIRGRQEIYSLNSKDWTSLIFIAAGGSVAATSLFTFSIKYGNPSVTVLLQKTQPLFAIAFARWFLHEIPGKWFWRWLPPALTGAYLVSIQDWRSAFTVHLYHPASVMSALGASILWGSSTVFGRYVVGRISIPVLTGLRFIVALPILAAVYWLQAPSQQTLPTTPPDLLALFAMAIIPGLVALLFYYKGLQSTIASVASVAELAFPVTAVAANWFLLGVHLTPSQFLGGSILVLSVTALTYMSSREKTLSDSKSG